VYSDLVEHFPAVVALLGIFASAAVALFWHLFTRMEKKIDSICTRIDRVVTQDECNRKHSDLQNFITAIIGVTNCKSCNGGNREV
jgi:hypothetical protein